MILKIGKKKFNRVPRTPVKRIGIILIDDKPKNIYRTHFLVNKKYVLALSINQRDWIPAIIEDGRYVIGNLLSQDITKDEIEMIDSSGIFYY